MHRLNIEARHCGWHVLWAEVLRLRRRWDYIRLMVVRLLSVVDEAADGFLEVVTTGLSLHTVNGLWRLSTVQ